MKYCFWHTLNAGYLSRNKFQPFIIKLLNILTFTLTFSLARSEKLYLQYKGSRSLRRHPEPSITTMVDEFSLLSRFFTTRGEFSNSVTFRLRLPMAESTSRSLMSFNFWYTTTVLFSCSKAACSAWLSWNINRGRVSLPSLCSNSCYWQHDWPSFTRQTSGWLSIDITENIQLEAFRKLVQLSESLKLRFFPGATLFVNTITSAVQWTQKAYSSHFPGQAL